MADLTFSIASETTAFDNGIRRGVIEPLEDADKALEDLGRAGDREMEQLEDSMSDARRDTERFEDSIKDVRDSLTRVGRAGKDAGDDVKGGMRRGEDGVREFKDEANSTAKEAAASFDGSAESIADAFQEVTANAFAGFGPAGAVAGTAAAIGIGAAVAGFEKVEEERKASEERIAEWAEAFIEAGAKVIDSGTLIARAQDILTDPEKFADATKAHELWGVSIETAVQAMAGSSSALREVDGAIAANRDELERQAEAQGGANRETIQGYEINDIARESYAKLADEIEQGSQRLDVQSRILRDVAESTAGATSAVDEFGDTVVTLPDGKKIYIDAETGQATQDTEAIEKKVYGIQDKSIGVTVDTAGADEQLSRFIAKYRSPIELNIFYKDQSGRFIP